MIAGNARRRDIVTGGQAKEFAKLGQLKEHGYPGRYPGQKGGGGGGKGNAPYLGGDMLHKVDSASAMDIAALCEIARELYVETFGAGYDKPRCVSLRLDILLYSNLSPWVRDVVRNALCTGSDLQLYLDTYFTPAAMAEVLQDPAKSAAWLVEAAVDGRRSPGVCSVCGVCRVCVWQCVAVCGSVCVRVRVRVYACVCAGLLAAGLPQS
jgi:hypothetical protein